MGHPRRKPLPSTEFSADVIDLSHEGRGFARVDGKATFIDGALPGERVRFRLTRRTRDVDDGVMTVVEQPSADRVEPRCPHFGVCGGCVLQHLAPDAQLVFKQKQLVDALTRLGGVAPEQIAPPVTGPVWAYRRRARLGVKHVPKKGGVLVGFRERASPLLAKIDRCEVLDARVGERIEALAALIGSLSIADAVPQIELAAAEHVALVLRVLRPPSAADLAALREFAITQDFDLYLQPGGPDSVTPLTAVRSLHYVPLEPLDGQPVLDLVFGPMDFIQVNGRLSQKMVQQALDWLAPQPGEAILELFSGLGNFTAPLAATGARVTAVEGEAVLVEKGRANLERNGLVARYFKADLFAPNAQAEWLRESYEAALLDPPRSGAAEVIPHVAASGARRIVYVSCHPGTLARDAGLLVKTHGYRLAKAGVLDMFPHTAHVESMALFIKP